MGFVEHLRNNNSPLSEYVGHHGDDGAAKNPSNIVLNHIKNCRHLIIVTGKQGGNVIALVLGLFEQSEAFMNKCFYQITNCENSGESGV